VLTLPDSRRTSPPPNATCRHSRWMDTHRTRNPAQDMRHSRRYAPQPPPYAYAPQQRYRWLVTAGNRHRARICAASTERPCAAAVTRRRPCTATGSVASAIPAAAGDAARGAVAPAGTSCTAFFLKRIFIDRATLNGTRPDSPVGVKPTMVLHSQNHMGSAVLFFCAVSVCSAP
jgi:hypothetical protein